MREVTAGGVANVRLSFGSRIMAKAQDLSPPKQRVQSKQPRKKTSERKAEKAEDVVCEDVLKRLQSEQNASSETRTLRQLHSAGRPFKTDTRRTY